MKKTKSLYKCLCIYDASLCTVVVEGFFIRRCVTTVPQWTSFSFFCCCWNLYTSAGSCTQPTSLDRQGKLKSWCKTCTSGLDDLHSDFTPRQMGTVHCQQGRPNEFCLRSHWGEVTATSRNLAGRLSRRSWSPPAALDPSGHGNMPYSWKAVSMLMPSSLTPPTYWGSSDSIKPATHTHRGNQSYCLVIKCR